ncbi:helix-turn-helix domain-containing protein [Aneurinibacillus terranovensis]|uniref:helix-turn-helix domain-containing protein n=1 Tax=Aneurinibacillus terranovensis TaxID=278991 RepID=UPI000489ADDA|nr:helix-turn-helix transcriptional regulator [Aneurinibacillus terranovensis]
MSFQERLRLARKQKRMTMEQIAEKIGVAKSTYASYELKYREPNIATIQSLASVLQVSTDYLLGIINDPSILETNAKLLLQNRQLHWDGIKLEEDELKSIRDFLEYVVLERVGNNS